MVGGRSGWTAISPFSPPVTLSISQVFSKQCHFLIKHTTQELRHSECSVNVGTDDIGRGEGAGTSVFPILPNLLNFKIVNPFLIFIMLFDKPMFSLIKTLLLQIC